VQHPIHVLESRAGVSCVNVNPTSVLREVHNLHCDIARVIFFEAACCPIEFKSANAARQVAADLPSNDSRERDAGLWHPSIKEGLRRMQNGTSLEVLRSMIQGHIGDGFNGGQTSH
jgi:hypothetical protein